MTISAERPRLILPGLLPADPALERYRVHPGAGVAPLEFCPPALNPVPGPDGTRMITRDPPAARAPGDMAAKMGR